ncbi:phragmoplast orienting kinesin 2 [Striga asiatica]|uniref:Phragmoplast orienting kinesin 2 n=1 Tax=Striga asiatica TaxID=4170 RepID=A0A5A7P2B5_STRAF|nr:phragmoplast orienting kinesin 2 [Striga asiatica]
MEAAVEVALPVSVDSKRLVGSAEGFGGDGGLVDEVRWQADGACSSGGKNDNIHAVNVSAPAFWRNIADREVCKDICHPSSSHNDEVVKDCGFGNLKSQPLILEVDAKPPLPKSGKITRKNIGCNKRSGMITMDVSKPKPGPCDVKNGTFPDLASSSASCNVSEKNQLVKQKISSASRRGDRRNSKANCKSRADLFSLKNGMVGFNPAGGGNNFIGLGGLKSDVFDITKYVDEPSLDKLLRGSYSCPLINDKEKTASNSKSNLLETVRNACSILRARKVSQEQNSAEVDDNLVQKDSASLDAVISAVGQTDGGKGVNSAVEKVQEPDDKTKTSDTVDTPLYKPRDILARLALPTPMDLDMLLSDASKTISTSKNNNDARLGKPVSHQTGLPPFPWSHAFSGHNNKLSSDAVKLSASRMICQGRWVRVKNCTALQKGCGDLLKNFESLTFDQTLVPTVSERPENEAAPIDGVFSASGASSHPKTPTDEYSTDDAAQTLLDMADYSKKNPFAAVNLLRKPSQMAMKASKSKSTEKPENSFQSLKPTIRPHNPLKAHFDGFSSKKPKLSTDLTNRPYITHAESSRLVSVKSPPGKLLRDMIANTDSCGTNLAKKSHMLKTPRGADRQSGGSKPKLWKSPY